MFNNFFKNTVTDEELKDKFEFNDSTEFNLQRHTTDTITLIAHKIDNMYSMDSLSPSTSLFGNSKELNWFEYTIPKSIKRNYKNIGRMSVYVGRASGVTANIHILIYIDGICVARFKSNYVKLEIDESNIKFVKFLEDIITAIKEDAAATIIINNKQNEDDANERKTLLQDITARFK